MRVIAPRDYELFGKTGSSARARALPELSPPRSVEAFQVAFQTRRQSAVTTRQWPYLVERRLMIAIRAIRGPSITHQIATRLV